MSVPDGVADPGAVQHGPLGEAPFSAPQARKILAGNAILLNFGVVFEWLSHGRQVYYHGWIEPHPLTPALGVTAPLEGRALPLTYRAVMRC